MKSDSASRQQDPTISRSKTSDVAGDLPLCVDLDGTLIKSDLLWESVVRLVKQNPLSLFRILAWLLRGRAHMKRCVAARVSLDPSTLPYNAGFVTYLRGERRTGRRIVLATASDRALALQLAAHLGVFDEVVASDGTVNMKGTNKRNLLDQKYGQGGYDYAGNAFADLAVWRGARKAIIVNAPTLVERLAVRSATIEAIFRRDVSFLRALVLCLRPHQWVKNLIVFVPIITSHSLADISICLQGLLIFAAFSLCASGVYVFNDLMDIEADRRHARKCRRPLAAGDLPIAAAVAAGALLLASGLAVAASSSWSVAGLAAVYVVLNSVYSWWARSVVLVDVLMLAGLYTIRLIAGHVATDIALSAWLLVFSMFIFLSLALVKRYVELDSTKGLPDDQTGSVRGYRLQDLTLVTSLGTTCGYLSVLVLALYVNSEQVVTLYHHPIVLLLACPLLLFWISRVWLFAHRGDLHDDPVVFALKDRASYVIGTLTFFVLWLATGM